MSGKHAVVLGGGFAGVNAAKYLARSVAVSGVTVIDRVPSATMVPALPDVLSGRIRRDAFSRPLTELLGDGHGKIEVVQDEIVSADLVHRRLSGRTGAYSYDLLVIANGSEPEFHGFSSEDGELHTAHTLENVRGFRREVENRLAAPHGTSPDPVNVVVVGGGYTGLEVAACLALGLRQSAENNDGPNAEPSRTRITVVEIGDALIPFLSEKLQARVRSYLEELDIDIRTGTSLRSFSADTAYLSDDTALPNAVVCWSAGMRAPTMDIHGGIERERDGRILTNKYLQLPRHPEVFVAGDAAALKRKGVLLRRAVNFAYYSGRRAGKNAVAHLAGRRLRPFSGVDLGWIIPLGGTSVGRIFGALPVTGKLGLRLHYLMCGFRHFGAYQAWDFYKTALHLKRSPDPPARPATPAKEP